VIDSTVGVVEVSPDNMLIDSAPSRSGTGQPGGAQLRGGQLRLEGLVACAKIRLSPLHQLIFEIWLSNWLKSRISRAVMPAAGI
jgi:hypothetical protein